MNKNFKVITINGIRGMIAVVFVILGLIAGFIISPGWVCMQLWNYIVEDYGNISLMNLYQGIMLWAIIALTLYTLNNKRALIGFGSYPSLSPEQIKDIMNKAKQSDLKIKKNIESINNEIKKELDNEISTEPITEAVVEQVQEPEKEEIRS